MSQTPLPFRNRLPARGRGPSGTCAALDPSAPARATASEQDGVEVAEEAPSTVAAGRQPEASSVHGAPEQLRWLAVRRAAKKSVKGAKLAAVQSA